MYQKFILILQYDSCAHLQSQLVYKHSDTRAFIKINKNQGEKTIKWAIIIIRVLDGVLCIVKIRIGILNK